MTISQFNKLKSKLKSKTFANIASNQFRLINNFSMRKIKTELFKMRMLIQCHIKFLCVPSDHLCDSQTTITKKTGLGPKKKMERTKNANHTTNLSYDTFFYITNECYGLHMRSTTMRSQVCVRLRADQSMGSCFSFSSMHVHLFSRRSFYDFF